jgi:hypothetical protein
VHTCPAAKNVDHQELKPGKNAGTLEAKYDFPLCSSKANTTLFNFP